MALSKPITNYDPHLEFLYYSQATSHREGTPVHHLGTH